MMSNHVNDAVLFTVCDLGSNRNAEIRRLLKSVQTSVQSDGIRVIHYVLFQRGNIDDAISLLNGINYQVRVMIIDKLLSLSRARNLMLAQAFEDRILDCAGWVGFPDDDAWYVGGVLRTVTQAFRRDEQLCMVMCNYGAEPLDLDTNSGLLRMVQPRHIYDVIKRASSITIMLRAATVRSVGYFDERLGLGGPLNGGEDLDYALRAAPRCLQKVLITETKLMGHKDRSPAGRALYFKGSLFALARAARANPRMSWLVARKLGIGMVLLLKRDLAFTELYQGVRAGWQALSGRPPEVKFMDRLPMACFTVNVGGNGKDTLAARS
jgi:hypothetical protein